MNARRDAIATLRVRIAEETAALALCTARGYVTDARIARAELAHFERVLAATLAALALDQSEGAAK